MLASRAIRTLLLVGWGSSLTWVTGTARADDDSLNEVVVTAQRRSESLQNVPISIGTLDGNQLTEFGAEGFSTFANRIAGLQITDSGRFTSQLSIRGIQTGVDTSDRPELNTTIGLYLDDVSIGMTSAAPNLAAEDLERVEVLRGPQGTLYGAGSEAGTIRLITNKPQLDKWQATVKAEGAAVDGGDPNGAGSLVLNAPLAEGIAAARAVAYYRRNGGVLDNSILRLSDTDALTTYGGRLSVLVKPLENLSVLLSGVIQNQRLDDNPYYNANVGYPIRTTYALEPQFAQTRLVSLTVDWNLHFGTLTSVSAYQSRQQNETVEVGRYPVLFGAPAGLFNTTMLPTDTNATAISQEVRLASNESDSDPVRWLVGGFFSNLNRALTQTVDAPGFEAAVPGVPTGPEEGTVTDRLYDGWFAVRTRQYAAFADATWKVIHSLEVSGGVRWYHYKQDSGLNYAGLLNDDGENNGVSRLYTDTQESGANPRGNISYHIDDDRMVYVGASRGFRLGGTNEALPADVCGLPSQPGAFKSDKLWNYEIGAKTAWADRKITVDGALFRIDFKDFQTVERLDCSFSLVQNAGKLVSQGAELEINARPIPELVLGFSGSYTDSELKNNVASVGVDGDRAPYVPKFMGSATAEYTRALWANLSGFLGADTQYVGDRMTAFSLQAHDVRLSPYAVFGARAGVESGPWRATVFGSNLGNRHPALYENNFTASTIASVQTTTLRPRTIGLRFEYTLN